jgi:hypothetical protein
MKYSYLLQQDINQDPLHTTMFVNSIGPYSVTKKCNKELKSIGIAFMSPQHNGLKLLTTEETNSWGGSLGITYIVCCTTHTYLNQNP